MAISVVEQIDSLVGATQDGASTSIRRFAVYDDVTPITTEFTVRLLFGGLLPTFGDMHPYTPANFRAADVSIEKYNGQSDVWLVTWVYRLVNLTNLGKMPVDVGYVDVSMAGSSEFEEAWRFLTEANIASLVGGADYPNGTPAGADDDIGGTKVDIAGEPVSGPIRKRVRMTVSETLDEVPNMNTLMGYVGKRNSAVFKGTPVGMAVYVSPQIDRIDAAKWRVSHVIETDNFYHLLQVPKRNPDGSVILDAGGQAEFVYARQPFPDMFDFYSISPWFASSGMV